MKLIANYLENRQHEFDQLDALNKNVGDIIGLRLQARLLLLERELYPFGLFQNAASGTLSVVNGGTGIITVGHSISVNSGQVLKGQPTWQLPPNTSIVVTSHSAPNNHIDIL